MLSVKSFGAVLVLVLGLMLAGCGSSNPPSSTGNTGGGTREIKVTGTDFKFDPGDQTFKAGERVKVTMTNKGAVDHTWVLTDTAGKELVKLETKVGQTGSKEFTAPAAGAYIIVCDIAGHKESGMVAKATVQ